MESKFAEQLHTKTIKELNDWATYEERQVKLMKTTLAEGGEKLRAWTRGGTPEKLSTIVDNLTTGIEMVRAEIASRAARGVQS